MSSSGSIPTPLTLSSPSQVFKNYLMEVIINAAGNAIRRIESDETLVENHLIGNLSPQEKKEGMQKKVVFVLWSLLYVKLKILGIAKKKIAIQNLLICL